MLEAYIRERKAKRDILLMTHIVVGYPSLAASLELVDAMVEAGVDLMELQIPFSEPVADGPIILRANQLALANHVRTDDCLAFAETVCKRHSIPFVFMGYYNTLYVRGVQRFVRDMSAAGVRGAIVADLPHEEAAEYLAAMQEDGLDPIFIFSPNSPLSRMQAIANVSRGFVYCVARKGVTGKSTEFSADLDGYFARCRRATSLPLALGFGVRCRPDVDFLRGKVDLAVVGSETLRVLDADGVAAVVPFLRNLVQPAS